MPFKMVLIVLLILGDLTFSIIYLKFRWTLRWTLRWTMMNSKKRNVSVRWTFRWTNFNRN